MPMKPLAGLFLALACVLGIAATGSVFELAYGDLIWGHPDRTDSWALSAWHRHQPAGRNSSQQAGLNPLALGGSTSTITPSPSPLS